MDDQDENQVQHLQAREQARQRVKSFVRKMQFESYVRSGLSPADAATRVGIKMPFGSPLKTSEILKIIEKGKLGR